jgi:hypothetical protein
MGAGFAAVMSHGPIWLVAVGFLSFLDFSLSITVYIGFFIYIYLGNSDDDGIALIREIRDLGDGRAVICVLWYAAFEEAGDLQMQKPPFFGLAGIRIW